MILSRASLAVVFSAALLAMPAYATRNHHAPTSGHSSSHAARHASGQTKATRKGAAKAKGHKVRGQQAIDSERVTQIQQALIREHYLDGEATGKWDAATIAAMQKLQADQGWQTKLMPDSRALKKLGLGPDYSNAINAKTGYFEPPPVQGTTTPEMAAGFAAGAHLDH